MTPAVRSAACRLHRPARDASLAEVQTVATAHSELGASAVETLAFQLVVIDGPDMGRAAALTEAPCHVGTDPDCELVLTDDRVSRRHLRVVRRAGGFEVEDLQSLNGTIYQGSRVTRAELPTGATLKLGKSFLRIQVLPRSLELAPSQSRRFGELVAESLAMREVFSVLELAARSDVTVLLEGETGVGKELAARAVHERSARRAAPFVGIDCAALPESLIESELFGHEKGAFTGASGQRLGAFRRAQGGTLFLDELDAIPLSTQARLLRAVEERKVLPVGADREEAIDIRLIAAAHDNLAARVADGGFRPDLYYRLSVVRIVIPPLRARREDLAAMTAELLRRRGFEAAGVAGPNLELLFAHDWPGNVRELRNVLERALVLSPGATCFADLKLTLDAAGAGSDPLAVRSDLPFAEAKRALLDAFERRYLRDLLARADGNVSAAAREAGLDRKHLRELAKRHGLL